MGLLINYNSAHESISSYTSETSTKETRTSLLIKEFFKKYRSSRVVLLLVVLLGTSMVICDGILTPSMSGLCPYQICFRFRILLVLDRALYIYIYFLHLSPLMRFP